MRRKMVFLLFIVVVVIYAIYAQNIYYEILNKILDLQKEAIVPINYEELGKLRKSFNINRYFDILKNIKLEEDWEIDYIYLIDSGGSYPVIFSYKKMI